MTNLVNLAARRNARRLREALDALNERLAVTPLPTPEVLGWSVAARDEAGRPIEVTCPRYAATAGYLPGQPALVVLEFRGETRAYELGLEELLLGLETGCLPDPVVEGGGPPRD